MWFVSLDKHSCVCCGNTCYRRYGFDLARRIGCTRFRLSSSVKWAMIRFSFFLFFFSLYFFSTSSLISLFALAITRTDWFSREYEVTLLNEESHGLEHGRNAIFQCCHRQQLRQNLSHVYLEIAHEHSYASTPEPNATLLVIHLTLPIHKHNNTNATLSCPNSE